MSLTRFYGKIFASGLALGAGIEVLLIKGNYYQMLAASEAKQKRKEFEQEKEDMERMKRLAQQK
ncbi:hypothetical protein DFQ28_003339 [Apophysomyces sp. BC1034]|nr:hypothetical protein DFQ30_003037 [Apophysomyces sp. BC1015]KAG0179523.1 hypothetical protein DFQ29_001999 [Apophysomyces sp. BC1021]KAG0189494.1 hypothetical protein DFQ28_003339 [Apophysomyces sp. BC1034]